MKIIIAGFHLVDILHLYIDLLKGGVLFGSANMPHFCALLGGRMKGLISFEEGGVVPGKSIGWRYIVY